MAARLRVLMIEDSEKDAALVRLELEKAGFELDWRRVETEEDLLHAFETSTWDLVISDYRMPAFDGLRAFALCREAGLEAPFIFVSGALGEDRAVEAMRAGARDYLLKDNLARLSVAVSRELEEARNRRKRKLAEDNARREQLRLTMAVEATRAAVFEHEVPLGPNTYLSERWQEIVGIHPEEAPPHPGLVDFVVGRIHADDRRRILKAYRDFVDGRTRRFQTEGRLRHHNDRWIDVAAFAMASERDGAGGAKSVVGVALDVSEHKRLEAQLQQAQRMEAVGRLAGGVAHDFNNLLTAILSFGDFALQELHTEDPAHRDVSEMMHAAKRAEGLTSQLLTFSRRKSVTPRVLDVNDVIGNLERMLQRLLREDVELRVELGAGLGSVRIDPHALEQVVVNLAVNARDAMPEGGRLVIETRTAELDEAGGTERDNDAAGSGSYVLVAVTDTGTGIDKESQSRIFEPFFTTKGEGEGTGLGLATCYGIVTQAGGQIRLESEPGEGTTFRVYLPCTSDSPDDTGPSNPAPPLGGSETILIVEDDEQLRRLATRALSRLGYHVLAASKGDEALVLCQGRERIDLLLTDVVMPGMSGPQLVERATPLQPTMVPLFMSGYTADAVADRGVPEIGKRLVQKPFTPEKLAQAVRETLNERAKSELP